MKILPSHALTALWTIGVVAVTATDGPFDCTLSGSGGDEVACTRTEDDDDRHCVWCALSGRRGSMPDVGGEFGVCVSEDQAETMERTIPDLVRCDRYDGGTDDAAPPADDDAGPSPATDDGNNPDPPSADDDRTLPDDYWTCLKLKDSAACGKKDCTWCDTPVGFGVCMTGPSADAASMSKWFTCRANSTATTIESVVGDPTDPSCALIYLQDPSKEACEAAADANGNPCEFCHLQDAFELCLNIDQAAIGEQYGLECGDDDATASARARDPMDPSCALVYLQDPSKGACEAAVDANGDPCEFCHLQGAFEVCLNIDQAAIGEQYGLECGEEDQEGGGPKPFAVDASPASTSEK